MVPGRLVLQRSKRDSDRSLKTDPMLSHLPDPLISVVMPAYRMGAFIGAALGTVAAQTYTHWEVLVVDDRGPEDGTLAIVQDFADRLGKDRVRLIQHAVNQGVSAARNTGITQARGEYVAFLDPDDSWSPDHLSRLWRLFQENPALDVATGPVEVFQDGPDAQAPWVNAITEWQVRFFPNTLALHNFIQPSASLVRRSALERVGGFDTDPAIQHIEDYDLWLRLVEQRSSFAFLPTPSSRYRKHAGGATSDEARMNRLHDHLYAKHVSFFRTAQATLLKSMMGRVELLKQEVAQVNIERHGPLMRVIRAVDDLLRGLVRLLRR